MVLSGLILWQMAKEDNPHQFTVDLFVVLVCAKMICAIILHMAMLEEARLALELMKYSINHSYMFNSWFLAFIMSFIMYFVTLFVEIICLFAITLQPSPL